MKRRWAVVAAFALVCLIGWSWLATRFGMSSWAIGGIRMVGMLVSCIVSFHAMRRDLRVKWPAAIALAGSAPMLILTLQFVGDVTFLVTALGPPIVVVLVGSVATSIAALFALIAPLPPPPAPPPVAPARVVED